MFDSSFYIPSDHIESRKILFSSLKVFLPYFEEFLEILKFNFGRCSVEYAISLETKLDLIKSIESSNS